MRSMTTQRSISWLALEAGTTVRSSDGEDLGSVTDVVGDRQKDIFSGLNIKDGLLGDARFVPADTVDEITPEYVVLTLSAEDASKLEPPE